MTELGLEAILLISCLELDALRVRIPRLRQISKMKRFGKEDSDGDANLLNGKRQKERKPVPLLH